MKKKWWFIGIGIMVIFFLLFMTHSTTNQSPSYIKEIYEKYRMNVEDGIDYLMKETMYQEKTEEEKTKDMSELLKFYEKKKKIHNLYYNETEHMFTFEYDNGILGGVRMKAFDPNYN